MIGAGDRKKTFLSGPAGFITSGGFPPKTGRKLRMLLKSADAQKPPIIAVWLSAGL